MRPAMAERTSQDQERLLEPAGAPNGPYTEPPQSRARPWKRSFPWILNVVLGIATIVLAVQLSYRDKYQHTGDVNGIAPRFSQKIVNFQPVKKATASVGDPSQEEATMEYWQTFAPEHFGFFDLPDYTSKKYPELAPPTKYPGGHHVVDTSMAHQLHCLHSIMESYNMLASTGNVSMGGKAKRATPHNHSWHVGHCFDYLRQGIMCCGDTALEGAATTFPDGVTGSDGWNAKHVCKDYDEVKEWLLGMNKVKEGEEVDIQPGPA